MADATETAALLARIRALEILVVEIEERWVKSQSGAKPRQFAEMHGTHLEQRIQGSNPAAIPAVRSLWAQVVGRFAKN